MNFICIVTDLNKSNGTVNLIIKTIKADTKIPFLNESQNIILNVDDFNLLCLLQKYIKLCFFLVKQKIYCFLNDNKCSKSLVLGTGAQKNLSVIESYTRTV